MEDKKNALEDPFSRENAYLKFARSVREATRLKAEIDRARASGDVPVREMLLKAVDALALLADNPVLPMIVRRELKARDAG